MRGERAEAVAGRVAERSPLAPLPPSESYAPGISLSLQEQVAACVYIVVDGVVKLVHVSPDGSEHIIELAGKGDFVGVHSAVLAERCSETAVTLTKCSLARWNASEFLLRLNGDPEFAAQVFLMICRHARSLRRRILACGAQPARRRLEALIRWCSRHGIPGAGRPTGAFDLPFTREELGQFLFITPFQVSRLLRGAEKAGLIARQGRRIRVLPGALQGAPAHPA